MVENFTIEEQQPTSRMLRECSSRGRSGAEEEESMMIIGNERVIKIAGGVDRRTPRCAQTSL